MSEGTETTRTTGGEGVGVRKTVDPGPEGTATVTMDVTNERSMPATVRLTETALASIHSADVDLHADYGAEYWRLEEEAVYEREFTAGESVTVVYRVSDVGDERTEALSAEPTVEIVDAENVNTGDVVDRGASDAVRGIVAGDRDSLLASPADETSDPESASDAAEAADPGAITDTSASQGDSGEGTLEAGAEPDVGGAEEVRSGLAHTPNGGVARVLVSELEQGHVDEETKAQLRAALEPGRSHDVRIKHLQSQVSDFAAYVEMLEEFVDRFGTIDDVFDGLAAQVDALETDLESVSADLEAISSLEADVADLDSEVAALREDHAGLSAAHDGTVDDVDSLADDHAALAGSVSEHGDGLEFLDGRVRAIESEFRRVHERMDEFAEFRDRLSGVFQEFGGVDTDE